VRARSCGPRARRLRDLLTRMLARLATALSRVACIDSALIASCASAPQRVTGATGFRRKQYVTGDSQEITQHSTNPAQAGLSCEF
jgi:hypothetical protein